MEHNELINTFARALKATVDIGAMYSVEHPLFDENIEKLHAATDQLFSIADPIKIGFSPSSLILGETIYEDQKLYRSLAHSFHVRKIKSLTFHSGVSLDELKTFLVEISIPAKEIIKKGGIQNILGAKDFKHIFLEELDYTELLYGDGDDCGDVWTYMLSDAVKSNNSEAISKYVDNFDKLIKKYKMHSLIEDPEACKNIEKFLTHLQNNEKEKYKECATQILKSAVRDREISDEENIKSLSTLIKNLNNDELADTLWEEIIADDNVDQLNLNLFSQLMDKDSNDEIAESLKDKMEQSQVLLQAPRVRNRIKDLFENTSTTYIPQSYRHFLTLALEKISSVGTLTYDRTHAERNYCSILRSLLTFEGDPKRMEKIIQRFYEKWDFIKKENDTLFIFDAYATLHSLPAIEDENTHAFIEKIKEDIGAFIEELIFDGRIGIEEFDELSRSLPKDTQNIEIYYDKFFNQNKVNSFTLQLLIFVSRYNPKILHYHLEQKKRDLPFIRKIIDLSATLLIKQEAADLLKAIYSFSGQFIKIKVLQQMAHMNLCDESMILPLLAKKAYHIKLEAMRVAMQCPETLHKALHTLFWIKPLFGINSFMIRSHIKIVETLDIREAKNDIERLAQFSFFWNSGIRQDAQNLLEKWNNG